MQKKKGNMQALTTRCINCHSRNHHAPVEMQKMNPVEILLFLRRREDEMYLWHCGKCGFPTLQDVEDYPGRADIELDGWDGLWDER